MNHFCSTVDSIDPLCPARPTEVVDVREAAPPLELPVDSQFEDPSQVRSVFRGQLYSLLSRIHSGQLTVVEGSRTETYGTAASDADPLQAQLIIADPAAHRRMIFGSTIGAAEGYMDGQWGTNDLTALIRIMIRNLELIQQVDRTWSRAKNVWNWVRHLSRRNTVAGSRKNIHDHYDLGNDFYKLFLDPSLSYSSAIFNQHSFSDEQPSMDCLHEASIRKLDVVREKLDVIASDHVLEIGTGWGAMAIHLASTTGCRVTTTTISKEQYRYAVEQVSAAGLSDQITVLQQDYRLLEGSYDKIVSIEMIEAVGHQYFDQFFGKCSQLLRPGGKMLLQGILIAGQHYKKYIGSTDFIRRYIFPGGCLPSNAAIQQSVDRVTDFQTVQLDDYTIDYALTLKVWREAFMNRLGEVRQLGYDQKFIRLWYFYLCYCEAAFLERRTNLAQIVFEKPTTGLAGR